MIESFGEALQRMRKARGMTLRQVAEPLRCSTTYLHDVENGHRNAWAIPQIIKIAVVLQLSDAEQETLCIAATFERRAVPILTGREDVISLAVEFSLKCPDLGSRQIAEIRAALRGVR